MTKERDNLPRIIIQKVGEVGRQVGNTLTQWGKRLKFEGHRSLPEISPVSQREKTAPVEIPPDTTVEESNTYRLPDGEVVGGKTGKLLYLTSSAPQDSFIPRDELAQEMYPDAEIKHARRELDSLVRITNKRKLVGTGVKLLIAYDDPGRIKRKIIGYHLGTLGQELRGAEKEHEIFTTDEQATVSVEIAEFGNLSKLDVALIAERLESNRDRLEPFLGERRVGLIKESELSELIDLATDQQLESLSGLSEEERVFVIHSYTVNAFNKAKNLLNDLNFDEILETIDEKNPNVWSLLVNLSEINGVIEKSGREEGVSLIGKEPGALEAIISELETQNQIPQLQTTDEVGGEAEAIVFTTQKPSILAEGNGDKEEHRLSVLERQDPQIRIKLNSYYDEILGKPELSGPVSPAIVTRYYPKLKQGFVEHAVGEGWILPIQDRNNKSHKRYDAPRIVALLYLYNNKNLHARLKKQVQEIANQEYQERLKDKENNK